MDGKDFTFQEMREGDVFDLGGIQLEGTEVPGHTQGSVILCDREENGVFSGDAIGRRTAPATLPPEKRVGLTACRDGLGKLLAEITAGTILCPGHGDGPVPRSMIRDMYTACSEVLDGKTGEDEESSSPFSKRPAAAGKRMREHRTGSVILVYDANTL